MVLHRDEGGGEGGRSVPGFWSYGKFRFTVFLINCDDCCQEHVRPASEREFGGPDRSRAFDSSINGSSTVIMTCVANWILYLD